MKMKKQKIESTMGFIETTTGIMNHKKSVFLVSFLNLFSAIGIIPFSVQQNRLNGSYYLASSSLKRVISGITQWTTAWIQVALTVAYGFQDHQNPSLFSNILQVLNNVLGVIHVFVAINLLWFRKEQLVKVLECTKTSIHHGKLVNHLPSMLLLLSTVYLTLMTYEQMNGVHLHFLPVKNGTFLELLSQNCILKSKEADGGCCWGSWTVYLMFTFMQIISSYACSFFFVNHYFFLLLGLSMLDLAKEFKQNLQRAYQTDEIHEGIELYLMLKMKVKAVNDCAGPLILAYYGSNISFLLEGPDILMGFKHAAFSEKLVYTFCSTAIISWIMFAQYHENVKTNLENWLEQNLIRLPDETFSLATRMKLMTILGEVKSGSLAVSCQYFGITNKILSSTLGLLVTYLIVSLQMQPKLTT